jgi:hypothetical protein
MMLVALPLFDLLCPVSQWLDGTPTSYRQLCVASFALGATLGVAEIVCFLRGLELPMARFASVLAVVFHMTLAAVVCEEASFTSDRTERLAAEEWTDLALARLPRDAAVVVRSPDLAWRLWSAQRVEGQRPDVLLVASPLLVRSSGLARLLPHGAEVAPLLRDLTLTGSASEFGLSVLADARPLRVELDAAWDEQMLGHVMVDGPWLRFDPEALGSSDRPADGTSALSAEARIAAHVRGGARRDQVSAEVLGRTLKEQTTALALLGLSSASSPLPSHRLRVRRLDRIAVFFGGLEPRSPRDFWNSRAPNSWSGTRKAPSSEDARSSSCSRAATASTPSRSRCSPVPPTGAFSSASTTTICRLPSVFLATVSFS